MVAFTPNPDYKHATFAFYRYAPTLAGAVIFGILFLLSTILHTFQMWKTRTWYLTAFIIGGFCEFIGYVARAKSATQTPGYWTLFPYAIQNTFLLIAPALFAASIYMILGRIILLTDGEAHSIIKRRWLTRVFVFGDIFSFFVQSGGAGMMAAGRTIPDLVTIGEKIIIVGLFLQLFFFAFFMIVAAVFHYRMRLAPTLRSQQHDIRWQYYLGSLYFVSTLILTRSIMRVIEYLQGRNGYILAHEVFLYVFDGSLMFALMIWMNWKHPSEIGLLLRGEQPTTNGLMLVTMVRPKNNLLEGSA